MTREEKIKGLYSLKEYLVENPIELEGHKSLPITLIDYAIEALEQEPRSEWEQDHEILKAYSDGANEVLDKIRTEIAKYGSIMVSYAITKDTKTDKGIEKLVSDVLKEAKEQVLEIIDKYKEESEG